MTRHFRTLMLTIGILALASSTPMAAANKEHQQMMADIRMLQQQSQLIQAQLAALTDVLKTVTTRLDDQAGANRRAAADQKQAVDTFASDLRVVREKVDETNVRLSSLSQEVEGIRVAQATVPASVPTPPIGDPQGQPVSGQAATPTPGQPATVSAGMSPQRLFEAARADYWVAQWSLAIQGFETYLKTFPKSDLADDAQYYIGESHYSAGKFRDAIAAYDRVIAGYPTSNTLPDVYYKRGMAFNALAQVPQARESFEFVAKTYPDSDAGRLAKQALDRLGRIRQ
jgi:tol-pal system protein YbgF